MIKGEKGQSLVEFSLVLPLLLLLICGIVDLGRLLYAYSSLQMTVQEAVRLGGLDKTDAEITAYVKGHLRFGDPAKLTNCLSGTAITAPCLSITPNDTTRKSGQDVTVILKCPLPFITPVMSKIIPAPVLSANSTIRVE